MWTCHIEERDQTARQEVYSVNNRGEQKSVSECQTLGRICYYSRRPRTRQEQESTDSLSSVVSDSSSWLIAVPIKVTGMCVFTICLTLLYQTLPEHPCI